MTYNSYEHFLTAAQKFPRWTDMRRRPLESNGGKILKTIIEEIEKVEDAILDYKKSFFIINYIGKEDSIIDYLYSAQVGEINDLSTCTLIDPYFLLTDDINYFYNHRDYAYYQDGYVVMYKTNNDGKLIYTLNDFKYSVDIAKTAIWNIFDEFAFWMGLERFADEDNKSLAQRSLLQCRNKPNSTINGIKNCILNALSAYGNVDKDEIEYLNLDENTLALKTYNGETVYEQIAQYNRDIARTRRWDIDYWENSFRQLTYAPHIWDAAVDDYRDGVGYNNSLLVSTPKFLDVYKSTNVDIYGYKKSKTSIESYINKNTIYEDISLELLRYTEEIKPINVQYKITASTISKIEDPTQIYFDFYDSFYGLKTYEIDTLAYNYDKLTPQKPNKLTTNKNYKLIFRPNESGYTSMRIDKCALESGNNSKSLLTESGSYKFSGSSIINNNAPFHGTNLKDFNSTTNFSNDADHGIYLTEPLQEGNFQINLKDWIKFGKRNFYMDIEGGELNITTNGTYVHNTGYILNKDAYQSQPSIQSNESFQIELNCRNLSFDVTNLAASFGKDAIINIETSIDGVVSAQNTYKNLSVSSLFNYRLKQNRKSRVIIKITRLTNTAIAIENILASRYYYKLIRSDTNQEINTDTNNIMLDQSDSSVYLNCIFYNDTTISPIIRFVHIGSQLSTTNTIPYEVAFNTNGLTEPVLNIDSNCNITLINLSDNATINNYNTHTSFYNATDEMQRIVLDLSIFSEINSSNFTLHQVDKFNRLMYIEVSPGQAVKEISISGGTIKLNQTRTLKDLLGITTETIYLSKEKKAFIVQSANKTAKLKTIKYQNVNFGDTISIRSTLYNNLQACFITNAINNMSVFGTKYSGTYDEFYLFDNNNKTYVAYNKYAVIKKTTSDIAMVNNFLPSLPSAANLIYVISEVVSDKTSASVIFNDENKTDWSIDSTTTLQITSNIDFNNTEVINTETKEIKSKYQISNNIPLTNSSLELGRYIITPPDNMNILYTETTFVNSTNDEGTTLHVDANGFNKLRHSKIVKVLAVYANNKLVSSSEYFMLLNEGIIVWANNNYVGESLKVQYIYNNPRYLTFNSLDYLYDVIGYNIDAMELVNAEKYQIKNAANGATINIDSSCFQEIPDYIVAECTNPCYVATATKNSIHISKIADDNTPIVHNGYIYEDGNEYYYFANRYEQRAQKSDGVDINNGEIINNQMFLKQRAVNYLKNSRMECNRLNLHCLLNFDNEQNIPDIEILGHIGACDSFALWEGCNMDVELLPYINGTAIKFSKQNNGYAFLDITKYLTDTRNTISCLTDGKLKIHLGRELRILDQQAMKSNFIEELEEFQYYKAIAYYFGNRLQPELYRYYLVIEDNGILDEVLIHDANNKDNIVVKHEKALNKFGVILEEEAIEDSLIKIEYTPEGSKNDKLEYANGYLQVGTTIDWGLTKIADIKLEDCETQKFQYRNEVLVSDSWNSMLETLPFAIENRSSITAIIVKINDLLINNYQGFNIRILGSTSANGNYEVITSVDNDNMAIVGGIDLYEYIKIRVFADDNKIIKNIELLAQYREASGETLTVLSNNEGTSITKVFDTSTIGNYRVIGITAEDNYKDYDYILVRGAKKSINDELIWTEWKDIKAKPEFEQYHLFQFKIHQSGSNARLKIKTFNLEVFK